MLIVDTHTHTGLHLYEPVEILLAQMEHNQVAKTVLVQSSTTTDNAYLIESLRRYPGRFSAVCRVDVASPNAPQDLERWHRAGADGVRFRNFDRSPGADPLAVWRKAAELGMSASVGGPTEVFASAEFSQLAQALPNLKIVIEHLGGAGYLAIHHQRQEPPYTNYRKALELARWPNTYMKLHGTGEYCPAPFPYREIPPLVELAYQSFGPRRMMWGSDFPPVSLREGYRNSLRFTMDNMPYASDEDKEWIFGKTALGVYQFP